MYDITNHIYKVSQNNVTAYYMLHTSICIVNPTIINIVFWLQNNVQISYKW